MLNWHSLLDLLAALKASPVFLLGVPILFALALAMLVDWLERALGVWPERQSSWQQESAGQVLMWPPATSRRKGSMTLNAIEPGRDHARSR